MSVLDILKMSGALPLNELNLRSSGSADDLLSELQLLREGGLVEFEGDLPDPDAIPSADNPIRLTRAGIRGMIA